MRYQPVLSIFLFTLGMNACNSGLPSPAPSPSATPHPTPISFQIAASATPSFHFDTTYQETALSCTTYIETTWGSGPGQWGDPTQLGRSHDMVPPPAFNTQSELYVSDFSNHRLLKYDGHNSLPVQTIPLPEHYFYNLMGFLSPPWAAIAIAKDRIFIPYSIVVFWRRTANSQAVAH
ncbi:MAG: hypothetical protein QMD04_14920, partial [Anaerolineales bacterium]|nr:hypothetical protein [Anaerolineales bacterium]